MPTFAVLGSGVDVCYPKSNRKLYDDSGQDNSDVDETLEEELGTEEVEQSE